MNSFLKKLIVIIPVIVLGMMYLGARLPGYSHTGGKRLYILAASLFFLYGWFLIEVIVRKQDNLFNVATQSSFFVYVFMVLTLTGFFILFREVSAQGWWHRITVRIDRRDRVNLQLFQMFHIYRISSTQIVGNFIMLMPLGFYLPLLYRNLKSFFAVAIVAFIASFLIEFLQLITSFRSADVDDILLNTIGACVGFVIFRIMLMIAKRSLPSAGTSVIA
ncbi:MAG: VanZ family protein [Flavisolibacter sp.]|jgi:glycopeptide antibiotics resistance protein